MRQDIAIADENGTVVPFELAQGAGSQLLYQESTKPLFKPSVQIGEATYASLDPETMAIFAQDDLSGGVGKRFQSPVNAVGFKQFRYAEGVDAGIYGILPGPAMAVITKIADSGSLTGSFELGGYLYLVCGRIVVKYDHTAGTIASVKDLGAGVSGYSGAAWLQEGTEASDQSSAGTGASFVLNGPQAQASQKETPGLTGYLGRVDIQLTRADTVSVQTVTITGVPTGATFLLAYASAQTSALAFNVSAADMQTALRLLPGLSAVTVIKAGWTYTITFTGVTGAAQYLVADGSALTGGTLPNVTVSIARIGTTVAANVELAIQADVNGRPSGVDLAVATVSAAAIPTTAGTVVFRFDDSGKYLQVKGELFHQVLRAIGSTPTATIAWTRTTAGTQDGYISSNSGNSWTAGYRFKYESFAKSITATAFVGKSAGSKFLTSSDGATFTADPAYEGKHFCVFQDLVVRDCRETSAGAISWSSDGKNWSEPLAVGDPNVQVTNLLALPNVVLVCKEDGVWAVDPNGDPAVLVDSIVTASANTANGVGATVWRQTAYIPFNGGLVPISGDFSAGFTVAKEFDIGPTALPEWESPWGAGRIVAVAGDRHCLYAALSTTSSYKLFKSYSPGDHQWIGSIADLGTPTTLTRMVVFDRGGDNSPLLFVSGDSDNLTRIILSRNANPPADSAYQVSTAAGSLFYPSSTGLMPANPKDWFYETATFLKEAAGGSVEMLYDTRDSVGWRRLAERLYQTGIMRYPAGLDSLLLDRQTLIKAASSTDYPVLLTSGVTYTVRPAILLKEYRFTIQAEKGMSGNRIGDMLGVSHQRAKELMDDLPVSRGTRTLTDPDGDDHQVAFRSVNRTLVERAVEGHSYFEVIGVGV